MWTVAVEIHTISTQEIAPVTTGRILPDPGVQALLAAKQSGDKVLVIARHPEYYPERIRSTADRWEHADTSDPAEIARAVLRVIGRSHVRQLFSFVDSFVGTTAIASALLGIPSVDPLSMAVCRNKSLVRDHLAAKGSDLVRHEAIDLNQVDRITSPIGYPAVAKPVDGAASWDVELVTSDGDLQVLAHRHQQRSYGRGARQRRQLVVEEVLTGPVWSCEGVVSANGEPTVYGWTDREITGAPGFIEISLGFAPDEPIEGGNEWVRTILSDLEYDRGGFHLECALTPTGIHLIEINPRLAGGGTDQAMTSVYGTNIVGHTIAVMSGETASLPDPVGATTKRNIYRNQTGRVSSISGMEAAAEFEGFIGLQLDIHKGDVLDNSVSSPGVKIGYVLACGQNREQANHRALSADKLLTIETT